MHLYPEIPESGIVTEIWHAEKWRKDLDPATMAPMYVGEHQKHYYRSELAQTKSGDFVIPVRWVKWKNKVHAEVFRVIFDNEVKVFRF